MTAKRSIAILPILAILLAASLAHAGGLSGLDPFNKNSEVRKAGKRINNAALDTVEGTEYRFTVRNPNKNGIPFRVNGKPYLLLGHQPSGWCCCI